MARAPRAATSARESVITAVTGAAACGRCSSSALSTKNNASRSPDARAAAAT